MFVDEHVAKEYECSTVILDTCGFCSKELDLWDSDPAVDTTCRWVGSDLVDELVIE